MNKYKGFNVHKVESFMDVFIKRKNLVYYIDKDNLFSIFSYNDNGYKVHVKSEKLEDGLAEIIKQLTTKIKKIEDYTVTKRNADSTLKMNKVICWWEKGSFIENNETHYKCDVLNKFGYSCEGIGDTLKEALEDLMFWLHDGEEEQMITEIFDILKNKIVKNKIHDVDEILFSLKNSFKKSEYHDGYGSVTITTFNDQKFTLLNAYGDEDSDSLGRYDGNGEWIVEKLGFSFIFKGHIYCFDMDLYGNVEKLFKSSEKITQEASYYTGKRAFYFYRDNNEVSLRGKCNNGDNGKHHKETENWASGSRTLLNLDEIELID